MRLSGRALRAVALMLVAVLAVAAISIYYLRPWTAIQAGVATTRTSVVPTRNFDDRLSNYHFVSTALGWAVITTYNSLANPVDGNYWVFKTVDAGRHWQRQLGGRTARLFLTISSLWFADANTGYVIGGNPVVLYRTRDGGDHWTQVGLPAAEVQELQFVDQANGFAVASSPERMHVFATHDGGATWSGLPSPPGNRSFWPQFRTANEAWSGWLDNRPFAYVSLDGGLTWDRRSLPTPQGLAGPIGTSIDVAPPGPLVFAYVTGSSEQGVEVYSSVDYGETWAPATLPSNPANGLALVGVDSTDWWVSDDFSLYRTSDAGKSWVQVGTTPPGLRLLKVIDSQHAWGVQGGGGAGRPMLTSDGGRTWDSRTAPNPL